MKKEINTDIGLEEMTLHDLLTMMADNKALTATLECGGFFFNIHVSIEPVEEEEDL